MSQQVEAADTTAQFTEINEQLEDASPQDILQWAVKQYTPKITMATSFGAEGMVIIHMLYQLRANIPIINLDTGYQFPETIQMVKKVKERYGITIQLIQPETSVKEYEQQHGGKLYQSNPDQCCFDRKIVPLQQGLKNMSAWISSIRREQTAARANAAIVEKDNKFNLIKVNPLANWKQQQVWDYIKANEIPYHPLYDRGFKSIGCWPCTRAIAAGEEERAGRWSNFNKTECGLHTRGDKRE